MKSLFRFRGVRFLFAFTLVFTFLVPAIGVEVAATLGGICGSASAFFYAPAGSLLNSMGMIGRADGGGARGVYNAIFDPQANNWGYPAELKSRTIKDHLRLEAIVSNTSGELVFSTQVGDSNSVYPTERRLNRNDHFVAYGVSLLLLKQDVGNRKTNGMLYSYPNVTEFGAAAAADLLAIYTGGRLNITLDQTVIYPDYPCIDFLKINQTQKSAATNYDQFSFEHTMVGFTPMIRLKGAGTNELSISKYQYPAFAGASAVVGTEHRAALIFHGFTLKGAEGKAA